jgi:aminopeptidase-like protein
VRETLRILQELISLDMREVPSGTPVFDWTVPREWNITDAYVKNEAGERIINFQKHSLHVMSYSIPVHATMWLDQLEPHLHSLPDQPDLIPYRTSYYKEDWAFCLSHNELQKLRAGNPNERYEVCIDSTLDYGNLTYGEYFLRGDSEDEVLISCHVCHPSLANDNLSGIVVAANLAKALSQLPKRRYSYRFLFIPGTIGSITWLSMNRNVTHRIKHGLVLTGIGNEGQFTYKKSRQGSAAIDRIVASVLKTSGAPHEIQDFIPYGYDERQYCSPGFNLPVGCFMRTSWGQYPQYHTSADNLDFIRPRALADSFDKLMSIIGVIEHDRVCTNQKPHCEPMLGKRGLYGAVGGAMNKKRFEMALLWVLNQSDGTQSLLDISERANTDFETIFRAAEALLDTDLLA